MACNKLVHLEPKTEDEIQQKRLIVLAQIRELQNQPLVWVTCPCGTKLTVVHAFKCWFCGIILCSNCAKEHFGKKNLMAKL